jgi:hypothetical protein
MNKDAVEQPELKSLLTVMDRTIHERVLSNWVDRCTDEQMNLQVSAIKQITANQIYQNDNENMPEFKVQRSLRLMK